MPCGISKGIQTLPVRSMPRPTGRDMPKLTLLQLTLARSTTSHLFGWRLLLRQQFLQAPVTILFALTSHRREMYRHTRECGLYELQAKALKVTRKTKVMFKHRYFKLQILLLAICNKLLLWHGFTFTQLFNTYLFTHSASGLSLLCPVLSHPPSSNFDRVWLLPIWSLPSNKDKPSHSDKWLLFTAQHWSERNLKEKFW